MLSPDSKTLVVATISDVKLFTVRRRKGDEKGALRIQKIDIPKSLSREGARLVNISSDSRWLCIVRPNSSVYVARIQSASLTTDKLEVMPQLALLQRIKRHTRHEKASHGTLGEYERVVRSAVFSDDSKILAVADLSGCVDTWVLNSVVDSAADDHAKPNGISKSGDDSSDDEDEEEEVVFEGERWQTAASESPIPRMKAGITLLSFRPQRPSSKALTNGHGDASSSTGEDRLMVITSEHQLIEFEARSGKLSDWSRRNPKAFLPAEFRGVKDRAMGCLWDLSEGRERVWLYGTSWLWMFDTLQDFPSPEEFQAEENEVSQQLVKASKRKRDPFEDDENDRKKPNSGAGDKISRAQMDIHLGAKVRKIVGPDESQGEWISLDQERPRNPEDDEAYEYDENFAATNQSALARLRREDGAAVEIGTPQKSSKHRSTAGVNGTADTPKKQLVAVNGTTSQPPRRWWHTYKYRDILGIVPLGSGSADDPEEDQSSSRNLEVAVVERPMWDVELPGRYLRDYE